MKTFIMALKIFLFFSILTGVIYPLFITGIAQLVFPSKANGSLIVRDGKVIGSKLIAQSFDSDIYFASRPSAINYNPLPSGGSNYGPTSKKLQILLRERKKQFFMDNQIDSLSKIPSEMVFASASGLDPHISPEAALLQVDRVAMARHFNTVQTMKLKQTISQLTEPPQFLCLGEPRVNVFLLNLTTDNIR